jgi:hypothetical protein
MMVRLVPEFSGEQQLHASMMAGAYRHRHISDPVFSVTTGEELIGRFDLPV